MDPTKVPPGNVDGLRRSAREQFSAFAQNYLRLREELQAVRIRERGAALAATHLASETLLERVRNALARRFGRARRSRAWGQVIAASELFDDRWYSATYNVHGDRAELINDFVERGDAAGRRPNEVFDPEWYRAIYADVRDVNSLVHFIQTGAGEWRRPCASFDAQWYAASYRDAPQSGAGCLAHYLRVGRNDGRRTSGDFVRPPPGDARRVVNLSELSDLAGAHEFPKGSSLKVDVIVPVYAGLEQTRQCIESVLEFRANNESFATLIIVDDCSPEPAIKAFLAGLPADKNIVLLTNETNLGFVKSVNRAMQHSRNDLVLLNSDVTVHGDWLDRLSRHAERDPEIGTATPFSNNGEICSFPTMRGRPTLPDGFSLVELDRACAEGNAQRGVDLPTGIGFCLFIRRQCLAETGLFDEEPFGRGYGEEVDFCMRSRALGWRHVMAGDVFVSHAGGVSFGDEAPRLKLEADAQLRQRHPGFEQDVAEWIHLNPALPLRVRLALDLLKQRAPVSLRIANGAAQPEQVEGLCLTCDAQFDTFVLRVCVAGLTEAVRVGEGEWSDLVALLRYVGVDEAVDVDGAAYRLANESELRAALKRGADPAMV